MSHDDRKDSDDGGYRSPTGLSPDATDSKLKSNRTKAGLRASLACVQCRSKQYFLKYVELDPSPYRFLLAVINLCGALYLEHPRLNDIREAAYSAACGPLPFTVQSIQGLHLLAVIAFGENQSMHHVSFATRSLEMAIELGMHRKFLADRAPDPVWAESYRRTWWYIKFQGMIRRVNSAEPTVDTYDIESDADLPCSEEWEYQSGDIPMPLSLMQYERELELGRSDFPSLAFQLETCRIQSDITRLCNQVSVGDEKRTELVNQMDLRICDFLRRIPRWKMDVGLDSPIFRERIHALIRILRIHGETWPLSKKVAEDVQAVADEYLGPKCQFNAHADERNGGLPGVLDSVPFFETSGVGFDAYSFLDLQLDFRPSRCVRDASIPLSSTPRAPPVKRCRSLTTPAQPPPPPSAASTNPGVISAAASINPELAQKSREEALGATGDAKPKAKKIKAKKELEAGKNKWQEFNNKSKFAKANKSKKDSMFRTPEGVHGRVGFTGSGQAMRKDPSRTRHIYQANEDLD
ncbi:hypothetical protein NUW58_g7915 [Xylaria curta]|uniref:Uncharacterized protein n=1 Tax=Xylaria curta TaxID=42375 RepID=A0ACC1NDQ3_9PEZI|nr:hypothetical protein NUW58_g7915 [Xylaria curta]